jgi:hypothetical protein
MSGLEGAKPAAMLAHTPKTAMRRPMTLAMAQEQSEYSKLRSLGPSLTSDFDLRAVS